MIGPSKNSRKNKFTRSARHGSFITGMLSQNGGGENIRQKFYSYWNTKSGGA